MKKIKKPEVLYTLKFREADGAPGKYVLDEMRGIGLSKADAESLGRMWSIADYRRGGSYEYVPTKIPLARMSSVRFVLLRWDKFVPSRMDPWNILKIS
jgi:hypothetical protein